MDSKISLVEAIEYHEYNSVQKGMNIEISEEISRINLVHGEIISIPECPINAKVCKKQITLLSKYFSRKQLIEQDDNRVVVKKVERELNPFGIFWTFFLGLVIGMVCLILLLVLSLLLGGGIISDVLERNEKPYKKTFKNVFYWGFSVGMYFMTSLIFWTGIVILSIFVYQSLGLFGLICFIVLTALIILILISLLNKLSKGISKFLFIGWGV